MTSDLIRLVEKDVQECINCEGQGTLTDGEQSWECDVCKGATEVLSPLTTAVLPILKALEEESKKNCYYTESLEGHMTMPKEACILQFLGRHESYCRPCWSRHLIGGE